MFIGYARVSTIDQNLNLQKEALKNAGCEKIFEDVGSGAKTERKNLNNAFNELRKGDVFIVWRLDRLGRSLKDLIEKVNLLQEKGVEFMSLQENINTSSASGKLAFHLFATLAEFERDLIRERTKAGLEIARAKGKNGGVKKKLNKEQIKSLREMHKDKTKTIKDITKIFGVSKATLYRYL